MFCSTFVQWQGKNPFNALSVTVQSQDVGFYPIISSGRAISRSSRSSISSRRKIYMHINRYSAIIVPFIIGKMKRFTHSQTKRAIKTSIWRFGMAHWVGGYADPLPFKFLVKLEQKFLIFFKYIVSIEDQIESDAKQLTPCCYPILEVDYKHVIDL